MFLKYEIFIALRQCKCRKNQSSDKLESIRDVFETWNQYSQNGYVAGSRTTVGEQLVAFKECCLFWPYYLQKRKIGDKIWACMFKFLLNF